MPKPDADLFMRLDFPLDKKTVENQEWATGPPGLRAVGRQAVAGLLLAKTLLFGSCRLSEFTLAGPQLWPLKARLFCSQGIKGVTKTKTLEN